MQPDQFIDKWRASTLKERSASQSHFIDLCRLHGVDAPEKHQPCFDASGQPYRCGTISARTLDQFIGESPVTCRERTTDRYGRTIADCSVRGEDIELWLVRNGHALAYRRRAGGQEQQARRLGWLTHAALGMAETAAGRLLI